MYNILLIVQILVAIGIIGLVLIQHGKGADAGAAFGGGASGTVFGSRGAGNFLSRSTAILALVFFLNSLALAWLVTHQGETKSSIIDSVAPMVEKEAPTEEAAPGDVPVAPQSGASEAVSTDVPAANDAAPAADVPSAGTGGQQDAPDDVPAASDVSGGGDESRQ